MSESHFIRTKNGVKSFELDEIMLLEANDNHVYFRKKDLEKYELIRITMSAALKQLPPGMFVRISRTFAVSLKHIAEAQKELIIFKNDIHLEYTHYPKYWAAFLKQLKIIETPRPGRRKRGE